MRKIVVTAVLGLVLLAGCASDATIRTTASRLPGTYYSGDGLGRMVTVALNSDGTFYSDWQGCLGVYGEASGTWTLQGDQITFKPADEHQILVGYLRQATTVHRDGRLGFARAQDVDQEKIREDLVFFKQPERR